MAYKGHERSPLNRSLSSPDILTNEPICRKIYMEEFYFLKHHSNGYVSLTTPMTRHISCHRMIGHGAPSTGPPSYNHMDDVSKYQSADSLYMEMNTNEFHDSPMDVDQENSMDNITLVPGQIQPPAIASTPNVLSKCKVKYRGQVPILIKEPDEDDDGVDEERSQVKGKKSRWMSCWLLFAVACLLTGLCCLPNYERMNYERRIEMDAIKNDLRGHVKYQNRQVTEIVSFFDKVDLNILATPDNFLALIGPTGVGKSYCCNLIKRNFNRNHVFDVNKNNFILDKKSFHRDVPNLLIIDNLLKEDAQYVVDLLDSLPRGPAIYVVAIFNTQDMGDDAVFLLRDATSIPKYFYTSNYLMHSVVFDKINKQEVLENAKKEPDFDLVKSVIDEHNFDEYGLKGFRAKLNLILNSNVNLMFY